MCSFKLSQKRDCQVIDVKYLKYHCVGRHEETASKYLGKSKNRMNENINKNNLAATKDQLPKY